MKKRIVLGSFLAVFLLLLVPTVPSVEYNEIKYTIHNNKPMYIDRIYIDEIHKETIQKILNKYKIDVDILKNYSKDNNVQDLTCGQLEGMFYFFVLWGILLPPTAPLFGTCALLTLALGVGEECDWAIEILEDLSDDDY